MDDKLKFLHDLGEKIKEWSQIDKACRQDINDILDLLESDEATQFLRRALVRAAWGLIEGSVWGLHSLINTAHHYFPDNVIKINDKNGGLSNIKLVLKLGSGLIAPEWNPDFSGSGYQSFSKSIKIRHRLMHPKSGADLEISDEEFNDLKAGLIWFIQSITDMQKEAVKRGKTVTIPHHR